MRHSDVDGLYQLLAENRWNMERDYLQCVFDTDPSGLVVVVTNDGKIIGKAVVCVCVSVFVCREVTRRPLQSLIREVVGV